MSTLDEKIIATYQNGIDIFFQDTGALFGTVIGIQKHHVLIQQKSIDAIFKLTFDNISTKRLLTPLLFHRENYAVFGVIK